MGPLSLEYHDVVDANAVDESGYPGAGPGSYKLDRSEFERHLAAIADRTPRQPTRALDWLRDRSSSDPLFLTFDDGGLSAYTCIADALERRGWRGHFFVTAGKVGAPTFLSAQQIRDLHQRGHVIGTHSYSHPARMGACSPSVILQEWRRSTGILSDVLGQAITSGSVPGGFYTRPVAEAASAVGLELLFTSKPTTQERKVGGCVVLGRYTLRRWSKAATAAAMARGGWRPRAGQWLLYTGLNVARTIAGDHYTRVRQAFWRHLR